MIAEERSIYYLSNSQYQNQDKGICPQSHGDAWKQDRENRRQKFRVEINQRVECRDIGWLLSEKQERAELGLRIYP